MLSVHVEEVSWCGIHLKVLIIFVQLKKAVVNAMTGLVNAQCKAMKHVQNEDWKEVLDAPSSVADHAKALEQLNNKSMLFTAVHQQYEIQLPQQK